MNTTERRKNYTPEQIAAEKAWRKEYYAKNAEQLRAKARGRHKPGAPTKLAEKMTPEQRAAYLAARRERYIKNRDRALAYAAEYREKNHETLKEKWTRPTPERVAYLKEYSASNAESRRIKRVAWTAANRERIAAKNAEWLQNNLDKHRTHQHNRRAKALAGGKLSPDLVPRLLKLQRGRCACCGDSLALGFEVDHIVPLARGGENVDANTQLLTPSCNRKKGALPPAVYMQRRGLLL